MAYPFFLRRLLARSGLARMFRSVRRRTDGAAAYLHYYGDRVLAAPYEELRAVAALRDAEGPDMIDLASGEPRFDLAPSGSTKLPADRRGLPPAWGLPELREAVAAHLTASGSLASDGGEEVLITLGAAGAFSLAVDSFLNSGDKVVLFDPTSPLFSFPLRQRRARVRCVPTWVEQGRTRFHFEPFVKALKGARLVVVNSPANPTGGVLAAEDLEQVAWWAARHDALIFSDEAFAFFRYEGQHVGLGTFPKARGRTLTAGGVSKSHGLASARVGWLAGPRHLVRPCSMTAVLQAGLVPMVCQQIALAALRVGAEPLRPIHREFAARRSYAFGRLRAAGLQPAWPAGGFFFWVPVRELGLSGREFAARLAEEKRVVVWPGEHFGPSGAGHVRVSYATDEGRLHQGLSRLTEFVRDRKTARMEQAPRAA